MHLCAFNCLANYSGLCGKHSSDCLYSSSSGASGEAGGIRVQHTVIMNPEGRGGGNKMLIGGEGETLIAPLASHVLDPAPFRIYVRTWPSVLIFHVFLLFFFPVTDGTPPIIETKKLDPRHQTLNTSQGRGFRFLVIRDTISQRAYLHSNQNCN